MFFKMLKKLFNILKKYYHSIVTKNNKWFFLMKGGDYMKISNMLYIITFIMIIMLVILKQSKNIIKEKKKGFIILYALILVSAYIEAIRAILSIYINENIYILTAIEFSLVPMIFVGAAQLIFKNSKNRVDYPWIILCIHAFLQFTNVLSLLYDNNDNSYTIYVLFCILSSCYLMFELCKFGQNYQRKSEFIPLLIVIFITIGELQVNCLIFALASIFLFIYYNEVVINVDVLTDLLNQNSFKSYITNLCKNSTILVFDVDRFKQINDTYGHQKGDEILILVAKLIFNVYSPYGTCFRIGGDEFCVIIESVDKLDLRKINNNFFKDLEKIQAENNLIPTVSVGYACFIKDTDNVFDVIAQADKNMYILKEWTTRNFKN